MRVSRRGNYPGMFEKASSHCMVFRHLVKNLAHSKAIFTSSTYCWGKKNNQKKKKTHFSSELKHLNEDSMRSN